MYTCLHRLKSTPNQGLCHRNANLPRYRQTETLASASATVRHQGARAHTFTCPCLSFFFSIHPLPSSHFSLILFRTLLANGQLENFARSIESKSLRQKYNRHTALETPRQEHPHWVRGRSPAFQGQLSHRLSSHFLFVGLYFLI